jgi:MerR family transcriptional regulator, repressor of the yfmOP operon
VTVTPPVSVEEAPLRIGELAKRAGLTTRTLRYWEEFGLVKPTDHRCSGERLYSPTELQRVIHIRELQELLGLTLAEIRIVLESEDAVERARSARLAGASAKRRVALLDQAIEAHSRLIERMDDRLARISAFRDEWVQRGERMRERSEELRSGKDPVG